MSTLVLFVPPRQRLRARAPDAAATEIDPASSEYAYVMSPDGVEIESEGRSAAALLPKAQTIIAVLADSDVSWHRITLPKAPGARMRAALTGVLEDALLDEVDAVHLALAPGATAGQLTWVAAVDRAWLRSQIAVLQRARVFVDRVVPMVWPDE